MSNEIDKAPKAAQTLDGFEGYESGIEGKEAQLQSDRGSSLKLKFLNAVWSDPNERNMNGAELVGLDVQRKVQKWLDDTGPAETIVLAPGAKFPDIDALNAQCPQNEWREKFGKIVGIAGTLCRPIPEGRAEAMHGRLHVGAHILKKLAHPSFIERLPSVVQKDKLAVMGHGFQNLDGTITQRDSMLPVGFHPLCRDRPELMLEVDFIPRCAKCLVGPDGGQDREFESAGGYQVPLA